MPDDTLTGQPDDAELITRAIGGHDDAFRCLVQRYQGAVYGCTLAITRNRPDAADAAQEAFIRLHRNLAQFDRSRPLRPYLLRIAANCSRTVLGRRSRRQEVPGGGAATTRMPDRQPGPVMGVLGAERAAAVRSLVGALPRTLREVCSLFYFADCSCREVGTTLGMSENAVKVALHRARRQLLENGVGEWRSMT